MLGLKRGTVDLLPHNPLWEDIAAETIKLLKSLLNDVAVDIQHVGSTSIRNICAKPIIDIAVGVNTLDSIKPYIEQLEKNGIIFRKEDVKEQLLFVIGDFEKEFRTHHIHVVEWNSIAWNNYINFRDYLNAFPEYAKEYDDLKKKLALEFANNRGNYTAGKQEFIDRILKQAHLWKVSM
ncbi:MAG: GrpB family protein [Clostridia bacterium]|nr:GrpB family protein [Clostridia bacterium]